jgi:hypothetical protein
VSNYEKLLLLNNVVDKKYNNKLSSIFISFKLAIKFYYLLFLQYANNSVVKINKNTYEVSYIVNGKKYKFYVKVCKGPNPISKVLADDNIITEEFMLYYGPSYNFHNISYTPEFFKCKKMLIHINNDELIFHDKDEIKISS